jgi:hypothetical protein
VLIAAGLSHRPTSGGKADAKASRKLSGNWLLQNNQQNMQLDHYQPSQQDDPANQLLYTEFIRGYC